MYEARQNKEKVSRRIDSCGLKQAKQFRIWKKEPIKMLVNEIAPIQRWSFLDKKYSSITLPDGNHASICTSNTVVLYHYDSLNLANGSAPEYPAEWDGWLLDKGNGNNATQCHVINQNFGGSGKHLDHNLHPGSHTLNDNHKSQMENIIKKAFKEDVKGKEGTHLEFTCNFQPSFNTNVPLSLGQQIDDPTITGFYSIHYSSNQPKHIEIGSFSISSITKGRGMYVPYTKKLHGSQQRRDAFPTQWGMGMPFQQLWGTGISPSSYGAWECHSSSYGGTGIYPQQLWGMGMPFQQLWGTGISPSSYGVWEYPPSSYGV